MDWFGNDVWLLWVAAAVLFGLLELLSGDLIFTMLGASAFGGAAAAALDAPAALQLAVFGLMAAALLGVIRPRIAARIHDGPTLPTGQHGLVGRSAIVAETVTRLDGRVLIDGVYWTARPVDPDATYEPGDELLVAAIDGVTARVVRKES